MADSLVRPPVSARELVGPDAGGCVRPSDAAAEWISLDAARLDSWTALAPVLAGGNPVVCREGATDGDARALLAEFGVPTNARFHRYESEGTRVAVTDALARSGRKLAVQHVCPEDELPESAYVVPRRLISFLNNKANLEALVPPGFAPERRVVPAAALSEATEPVRAPVVLKAVTDQTSGGGTGVLVCADGSRRSEAVAFLARCREVVVEEFMQIEASLCLNFAVFAPDEVRYLGCAQQIMDPVRERFFGNWLEPALHPPPQLLAAAGRTVERASRMGYIGFAGVDATVLADGRQLIFDLNFRINASTLPVMLLPALRSYFGYTTFQSRWWRAAGSCEALLASLRSPVARNVLLPLGVFDAPRAGYPDRPRRSRQPCVRWAPLDCPEAAET